MIMSPLKGSRVVCLLAAFCVIGGFQDDLSSKARDFIDKKLDKTKVTINERQSTFVEVLDYLSLKTGVSIVVPADCDDVLLKTVDLRLKNVTAREALQALLTPQRLVMRYENRGISVVSEAKSTEDEGKTEDAADGETVSPEKSGEEPKRPAATGSLLVPTVAVHLNTLVEDLMRQYGIKHCPATFIVEKVPAIQTGEFQGSGLKSLLNSDQIKEGGQPLTDEEWDKIFDGLKEILITHGYRSLDPGALREKLAKDFGLVDGTIRIVIAAIVGHFNGLASVSEDRYPDYLRQWQGDLEETVAIRINKLQNMGDGKPLNPKQLKALCLYLKYKVESLRREWAKGRQQ